MQNQNELTFDKLKNGQLWIFGSPRELFSKSEFEALKQYVSQGGNILFLSNEGGETKGNTNLNYLLEQYGISINTDCVIRTSFLKYLHPKECYVQNGVLNKELVRVANNRPKDTKSISKATTLISNVLGGREEDFVKESEQGGLEFVYPYGASLNVQAPAHPLLSTGFLSYPMNRPVGAIYISPEGRGKIACFGSFEIFGDEYFDKEENGKILDFLIKFYFSNECEFEFPKSEYDLGEYHQIPEVAEMAEKLKSCLQVFSP